MLRLPLKPPPPNPNILPFQLAGSQTRILISDPAAGERRADKRHTATSDFVPNMLVDAPTSRKSALSIVAPPICWPVNEEQRSLVDAVAADCAVADGTGAAGAPNIAAAAAAAPEIDSPKTLKLLLRMCSPSRCHLDQADNSAQAYNPHAIFAISSVRKLTVSHVPVDPRWAASPVTPGRVAADIVSGI
ncbi:hypothetical protein WBQ88_17265 [Sphingopyxis sp. CCNWLW253]|uniref:hypothetical protein n=1 Tax=unclassified Sphingopyxis TaxID=2614943 RepID=UPI00301314CA